MADVVTTWLAPLVLAAGLAFWALTIVDFARADSRNMRTFSREVWAAIIVFGSVVGAAAWWYAGRPPQASRS